MLVCLYRAAACFFVYSYTSFESSDRYFWIFFFFPLFCYEGSGGGGGGRRWLYFRLFVYLHYFAGWVVFNSPPQILVLRLFSSISKHANHSVFGPCCHILVSGFPVRTRPKSYSQARPIPDDIVDKWLS